MPRYTTSFLFPDVNVWLALTYERHVHHATASEWLKSLESDAQVNFCRFTQLGFLRLLTTSAVMGADGVLTQLQAWKAYDRWFEDGRIFYIDEPKTLENQFRALSQETRASPKDWADSYLAAFAAESGLCLVTFDQALGKKAQDSRLLS
jgi:uncharacterized protein